MRRKVLLLALLCSLTGVLSAQDNGARMAARANVVPYDDENGIEKNAYRESSYFMELTGRWNQKQTDSSIVYSRDLEVAKYWKDYRVSLNVRCGKGCRVLLNGKTVGYGGDSRHWNEFLLTGFLKYGKKNTLAIEAMKTSAEALLENVDEPAGLNGEPYIMFKNDPSVADMTLTADYDALRQEGTLLIEASLHNGKKKGRFYLEAELWDPKGHTFDRMGKWVVFDHSSQATVDMSRTWNNVAPWSAETPNLYTIVLRLRNEDMEEEEVVGARIGFRHVEVKDGGLLFNGKPLTLKGVNYGLNRTEGSASRERMRNDLHTMKNMNVNAVHTSKFSPMDPYFYELCDEMGLYVVCDANLLPASTQQHAVATDREFIPLFERRVENMYGKYKNHTSILAWSLGESRDNGACMTAAYKRLKALDKSRPVIFSGADFGDNTDVVALSHPTQQTLRQAMEKTGDKPVLLLAAAGEENLVELEQIWNLVETRRVLQGGFVDVWPMSALWQSELRNLFSPFDVQMGKTTIDDAEFAVFNRNDFSDFSRYILDYTIFTNLRPNVSAGDLPVAIAGGGMETVRLRIPPIDLLPGESMMVRFDLERRGVKVGSPDRIVGSVVFELPFKNDNKRPFVNENTLVNGRLAVDSVRLDADHVRGLEIKPIDAVSPRFLFNPTAATISRFGGLVNSPVLRFEGHDDWKCEVAAFSYRAPDEATVCVDAMLRYTDGGREMCDVRVNYAFFVTGDVVVDYTLSPSDAVRGRLRPRIDLMLPSDGGDTLQWYGLDREVCFAKRNAGVLGVNSRLWSDLEGSTRQQVRWCSWLNKKNGLYAALLGEQFTMAVKGRKLILYAHEGDGAFRLHLRGYTPLSSASVALDMENDAAMTESPERFYTTAMPVVKSGIMEPPQIVSNRQRFTQPLSVSIVSPGGGEIRYTLDGSEPSEASPRYTAPLPIETTTVVKARVFSRDLPPSFTATRKFNYDYIVGTTFSRKPNTPFNVGTDTLLFDGEQSTADNLSQGWLGFSGDGVTTIVQLSKSIDIEHVTLRFAHAPEMWAFAPLSVSLLFSSDGVVYGDTLVVDMPIDPVAEEASVPQVVELQVPVGKPNVAYVKIIAESIGTIPTWHRAKGLKPWILMDEIKVGELLPLNKQ